LPILTQVPSALNGKVAIVTGSGQGIGSAIAKAYAKAGAVVCCVDRTKQSAEQTLQNIVVAGGEGIALTADVTQKTSVQEMVQTTVEMLGGLDILVINAGVGGQKQHVDGSDVDDWRYTHEVNLFGAYFCARAAIPAMKQRGAGKIITLGSGLGHRGVAGMSAYACSKAGLWMLTRVLAQELAPHNISVNELIPGPVSTAMNWAQDAQSQGTFSMEGEWTKNPDDVVPLALFLATQPAVGPTAQSFSLMRRDA
jgi:3-oxoacyl-[acyl-carrier protein] reductase